MAIITWKKQFSVNVKEIDAQHNKIIDYINELHSAMSGGKGKEILGDILEKLAGYTVEHFSTEEKYFDKYKYVLSVTHKLEHNKFVQKVVEFKKGYIEGNLILSVELMEFLKNWLCEHILGSDKLYTKCFNENGLS